MSDDNPPPRALVPTVMPSLKAGTETDPIAAALASVRAPLARSTYERDMREYLSDVRTLLGIGAEEASPDDLLGWWNWLRAPKAAGGRGLAPATVNRKVAAIRRLYRQAVRRGIYPSNPAEDVPVLPVDKDPQGRALTADEAAALLAACGGAWPPPAPPGMGLVTLRDRLVVAFLLMTGARAVELCRLEVHDLSWDAGVRKATLTRKGGRRRAEPLVPELAQLVDAWLLTVQLEEGPIVRGFVQGAGALLLRPGALSKRTVHRIVSERGEAAGLGRDVGPHDLRRTYATACLDAGVPVERVSTALGHTSLATTSRYLHQRAYYQNHPSLAFARWLAPRDETADKIKAPRPGERADPVEPPAMAERAVSTTTPDVVERAEEGETSANCERAGEHEPPVKRERAEASTSPRSPERAATPDTPGPGERAVAGEPPDHSERADTGMSPASHERAAREEPPVVEVRASEQETPSQVERAGMSTSPEQLERADEPATPALRERATELAPRSRL